MANQKSGGMDAAVIDSRLENRSASELPVGGPAADHDGGDDREKSIVVSASCSVAGNALSAIDEADSPVRSEVPKSRCSTPEK